MIAHNSATIAALYIGRVLAGLGIGFISLAVPIYISEISRM
jgi:MFS family permease